MQRLWLAKLYLAVALLSAAGNSYAQDFVLHTQNLLRFGQGTTANKTAKCTALNTVSASVDIIVIQELMQSAYPCAAVPTGFVWESYGPFGSPSYQEYYGFLWRNVPRFGGPTITDGGKVSTASGSFMRPPTATFLFIKPAGKTTKYAIWIANIHSIWGTKGVGPRQAEATAAAVFFTSLKKTPVATTPITAPPSPNGFPVIIAGDWNLPARNKYGTTNSGFDDLVTAGAHIEPNVPTSLTKAGKGSSPYDHFAFSYASLSIATPTLYPASTSWATWRTTVSDHLGVQVGVTFK